MTFTQKPAAVVTALLFFTILFSGCKNENASGPETTSDKSYYQITPGERIIYQIDTLGSGSLVFAGTLSTSVLTSRIKDSILYYPRVDTVKQYGTTTVTTKYLRTTAAGAYLNFDTTGMSVLIPDSIKQYLSIDKEIAFLSYPLTAGRKWYAFKISAIGLSLVDVMAEARGTDTVIVYSGGPVQKMAAERVDYKLTYAIPAMVFPGGINQSFTGTIWYAENKGIVKTYGNPQLVGILLGSSPVFADSATYYTQTRKF